MRSYLIPTSLIMLTKSSNIQCKKKEKKYSRNDQRNTKLCRWIVPKAKLTLSIQVEE